MNELFVQAGQQELLRTSTKVSSEQQRPNHGNVKLNAIMTHLNYEFMDYKYTLYRVAAKIITLQKVLYTTSIPYKLVLAVLERHGIRHADSNLMVPPFQLTPLIQDLYMACEKMGHYAKLTSFNLDTATSVLTNFFWNAFDPKRRHSISLLEIKITFMLFCKVYGGEQFMNEIFDLIADPKTRCVSKLSFENFLNTLIKLLSYMGEERSYGKDNISLIMEQCFGRCHYALGLTEGQFYSLWKTTDTQFLNYANLVALKQRLEDTEKVVHSNMCNRCEVERIVGIRFKCKLCKNLNLCFKCYATGYATNKHKRGHRMVEMYTEDLPPKKLSHFFTKICLFFSTQRSVLDEEKREFCNEASTINDTELITITGHADLTNDVLPLSPPTVVVTDASDDENKNIAESLAVLSTSASNASNVSERLQSIINRLHIQNAKLEVILKCINTASRTQIAEFLSAHQCFIIGIIKEMRNFSENNNSSTLSTIPSTSTPNASARHNVALLNSLNSSHLTHSINGADLNRTYLEANKSNYSLSDLSDLGERRMTMPQAQCNRRRQSLSVLKEAQHESDSIIMGYKPKRAAMADSSLEIVNIRDTEMSHFKELLFKVKSIVDDVYSDNSELASATQNLENVLDNIILGEETRRQSLQKEATEHI